MISVLSIGYLYWSSSWQWQAHIRGCKLLRPLPRAEMSDCPVLVNCCLPWLIDILSCHRIVGEIGILLIYVWIRIGSVCSTNFVGLGWLTLVVIFVLFAKLNLCTIFWITSLNQFLHNIMYNYTNLCNLNDLQHVSNFRH